MDLFLLELQFQTGKIVSDEPYNKENGGLIGFNSSHILVLDSSFNKDGIDYEWRKFYYGKS